MLFRIILFATLFQANFANAKIDIYFTPSKDCEKNIINNIASAKDSINIVMYSLNNTNIIQAIKKAHKKGVKIKILTDKLQASGRYSKVTDLYLSGVDIKVNSKHKIEHNKFAIFDDDIITTGSYNWTNAASNKNSENCVFITKENAAKIYQKKFDELWQINSKQKFDEWIKKRLKKLKPS